MKILSDLQFRNGDRDKADALSCFLPLSLTLSPAEGEKNVLRSPCRSDTVVQTSTKDPEEEQRRQDGATRSSGPEGKPRTRAL